MTNKVIKSVSFNVNNPDEYRMLKAVKRRNFSGYVKKLIAADLDAKAHVQPQKSKVQPQAQQRSIDVIETQEVEPIPQTKPVQHSRIAPEVPVVPEVKPQSASERLSELKRSASTGPMIFRP